MLLWRHDLPPKRPRFFYSGKVASGLVFSGGLCLFSSVTNATIWPDLFVSAKARSLGRTGLATVHDSEAVGTNAAGLAFLKDWQLTAPEWIHLESSANLMDFYKKVKNIDTSSGAAGLGAQLKSLDNTAVSLRAAPAKLGWSRTQLALQVNPLDLQLAFRVKSPTVLFASIQTRATMDSGVAVAFGQAFGAKLDWSWGFTLRPLLIRVGGDVVLEGPDLLNLGDNPAEFFASNADQMGAGWGVDFDSGFQGRLADWNWGPSQWQLRMGGVIQNALANSYSQVFPGLENFAGRPPALPRKISLGLGLRGKGLGVFTPTVNVEAKDFGLDTRVWYEHLAASIDFLLRPKTWFASSFRGHFYKGEIGGGLGLQIFKADLEFGSYSESVGPLPGIARDRRWYMSAATIF